MRNDLVQSYPIKNFWRVVREYGWPDGSKESNNACCKWLKKDPFKLLAKEQNWNMVFDGIRAEESQNRTFRIRKDGLKLKYKRRQGTITHRIHPIGYWTMEDMNRYIQDNNIPLSELYEKGIERSGCGPCTAFKSWEKQLAGMNMKMYKRVKKRRGEKILDEWMSPCAKS